MGATTSRSTVEQLDSFLVHLYETKTLTPKLWTYVKSKHQNVCQTALMEQGEDSIIWFSPLRNLGVEGIKSAQKSGYMLVYPPLRDLSTINSDVMAQLKLGGTLLVKEEFMKNFISCSKSVSNGFYWYNLATVGMATHTTPLIYNSNTKQFEWYDSNGIQDNDRMEDVEVAAFGVDQTRVKTALTYFLKIMSVQLTQMGYDLVNYDKPLLSVDETCPRIGPQVYQDFILKDLKAKPETALYASELQLSGFCQVWSMIILDERLSNPSKTPNKVMNTVLATTPGLEDIKGSLLNQKVRSFLFDAFRYLNARNMI